MNRGEASQPCLNGCFPSPSSFLPSENSHNSPKFNDSIESNNEFAEATCSSLHPFTQFTNHESLPSLHDSYISFIRAFPRFSVTSQVDEIRSQEYSHLNHSNTSFDYIGYGLFSHSQHQTQNSIPSSFPQLSLEPSFFDISFKSVNLQSQILYGGHESELESRIRERIMQFMNVSESDYALVFIANEVSAFKIIADSFEFQPNGELLTVYDHNSEALETMIQTCKNQGIRIASAESSWPNLGIECRKLKKTITKNREKKKNGLFVFPLHSRVSGTPYSYVWMSMAQENGWHVLLDTCALRPKEMGTLGMSMFKPDFMVCSFYKVFGENPSGFGCLFVKKSSVSVLKDLSVGIVSIVPTSFKQCHSESSETEILELSTTVDDSSNGENEFHCRGLEHAESVGLIVISIRTRCLVNWLVNALLSLKHPHNEDEVSLIKIYGPKISSLRGPSVAFNVFDWKGEKIDPALVQKLADRNNISLSNSVLKNIRFYDKNEQERIWALESRGSEVHGLGLSRKKRGPESEIFVVTAALGFLTNFEDTYKLWAFLSRFLDADFVEKERWRYLALNQKTIEV